MLREASGKVFALLFTHAVVILKAYFHLLYRFFFGKNKVIAMALGKERESEYRDGLHMLSRRLQGNVGLLFTNESKEAVNE